MTELQTRAKEFLIKKGVKTTGDEYIALDILDWLVEFTESNSFTKQELKKAWLHGAIRTPEKHKYLNNFDDYFKYEYNKK